MERSLTARSPKLANRALKSARLLLTVLVPLFIGVNVELGCGVVVVVVVVVVVLVVLVVLGALLVVVLVVLVVLGALLVVVLVVLVVLGALLVISGTLFALKLGLGVEVTITGSLEFMVVMVVLPRMSGIVVALFWLSDIVMTISRGVFVGALGWVTLASSEAAISTVAWVVEAFMGSNCCTATFGVGAFVLTAIIAAGVVVSAFLAGSGAWLER